MAEPQTELFDAPSLADFNHATWEKGYSQTVLKSAVVSPGFRHEIRRWWGVNKIVDGRIQPLRWAAWLMLNPSHAGEFKDDPTANRVTHFTKSWGYDGWIGVNVYPLVTSKPGELWPWCLGWDKREDWSVRDALMRNLRDIERAGREASIRLVAFGAEVQKRDEPWLEQCLEAFGQPHNGFVDPDCVLAPGQSDLYCLGTSKSGAPIHPLARGRNRVPDSREPMIWSRR